MAHRVGIGDLLRRKVARDEGLLRREVGEGGDRLDVDTCGRQRTV